MSCAVKFMKFILFSLNLLFVLLGLALVVAGTWAMFNIPSFTQAMAFLFDTEVTGSEIYQDAKLIQIVAYVCIGLGLFVFLLAFFGCCGVVTDSYCLLITYAVVVSLLFLAKIACVLLFLLLGETISPMLKDKLTENFSAHYRGYLGVDESDPSDYSGAMDTIMLNYKCCGVNGPSDFEKMETSSLWHKEGRTYVLKNGTKVGGAEVGLPVACCRFLKSNFFFNSTFMELHNSMENPSCPVKPVTNYNTIGCIDMLSATLKQYTVMIVVAPVIVAVTEVIGIILASALAHEVKQDIERFYY